jgi:hypothetical protein
MNIQDTWHTSANSQYVIFIFKASHIYVDLQLAFSKLWRHHSGLRYDFLLAQHN